jgi:tRNA (guanine-N7-)-methyltransferase
MTAAQARAFEEHWQRYGLVAGDAPLDLDAVFGRRARRVLEIGFGNGEALCEATQAEPGTDFIGIEVHGPGVGRLLKDAAAAAGHQHAAACTWRPTGRTMPNTCSR